MRFADFLAIADRVVTTILGEPVSYVPGVGEPVDVSGVFNAAYEYVDINTHDGVASVGPAIFLTLSDLPTDPETDTDARIVRQAVTYRAHTVKPDGLGGVLLLLHET